MHPTEVRKVSNRPLLPVCDLLGLHNAPNRLTAMTPIWVNNLLVVELVQNKHIFTLHYN